MSEQYFDLLPETVLQSIEGMALRFDPDEAKDLIASIQFNISPSASLKTGGDYYQTIIRFVGKYTL